MKKVSDFLRNLLSRCASPGPRTIAMVVLVLIAVAMMAIVGVRAAQIYSLAVDSTDGFDVDEAEVKVGGAGEFLGAITFLPLAQVFAGTSFDWEGMASPPQNTSVDIPGIGFDLTDDLLRHGWVISLAYSDENISTVLLEDEQGNRVVVAATGRADTAQLLSDINDQYSDMLPLFGFEVISSTVGADSIELAFSQDGLNLEAQSWIDPEDPDRLYVATFLTDEEDPSIPGADFDEIMALLQGES